MSLFKKAPRMQGFLRKNHREIVIKAQRGDVEEHLRLRCKRLTLCILVVEDNTQK
jgi:hypothetical protein